MSIFYRSERVGKNGKVFRVLKFRTLKEGANKSSYAQEDMYEPWGKFLRKTKLDELPQLYNVLKGDMSLVGPRAMEVSDYKVIPKETANMLLSVKPGMTSLSSIHFFDEEHLLKTGDPNETYWKKIMPTKISLDAFYVQNKSIALNLYILWATFCRIAKSLWKK